MMRAEITMHRVMLLLAIGTSLVAASGCHPATVRALPRHDPTLRLPDTIAGREALWWARFHGCAEVLTMVGLRVEG